MLQACHPLFRLRNDAGAGLRTTGDDTGACNSKANALRIGSVHGPAIRTLGDAVGVFDRGAIHHPTPHDLDALDERFTLLRGIPATSGMLSVGVTRRNR